MKKIFSMNFFKKNANLFGFLTFITLAILLEIRLHIGLDFTDESYYAFFIDDWLKGSIKSSTSLTIHQTAALLVYPFCLLYFKWHNSNQGLFIFLRQLFLFFNLCAATTWIYYLKRLHFGNLAWLGGILILGFIPFGLPAPSYNTLGNQFLLIALAGLGIAQTHLNSKTQLNCLLFSSLSFAIASIAYPSLLGAIFFLCCLVLLYRNSLTRPNLYLAFIACTSAISWLLVFWILSPEKILQSILYLSLINNVTGVFSKFLTAYLFLHENKVFFGLLIFSIFLGVFRNQLSDLFLKRMMAFTFLSLLFIHPALFGRAHDAIFLAACMGLGLLSGLKPEAPQKHRILAILYATSMIASILITFTASNSIYNFCIGAMPAALISVFSPEENTKRISSILAILFLILSVFSTSFFLLYGEPSHWFKRKREYISQGFFAGTFAWKDDAQWLHLVEQSFLPLVKANDTLAIFAFRPGIALITPTRIKMLSTFPLNVNVNPKGLAMTLDFYKISENRPKFVIVSARPVNPMQPLFSNWYSPLVISNPELTIYIRKK